MKVYFFDSDIETELSGDYIIQVKGEGEFMSSTAGGFFSSAKTTIGLNNGSIVNIPTSKVFTTKEARDRAYEEYCDDDY